jgi:hypothetical protein
MVAIAVTLNNDHDAPHIEISLSGITNPGSAYTVYRIDNTGEEPPTPVRGLDQIIPSAATDAANDFEAPIGKSLSYKVVQGGDEDEDGPVTIPVPSDFGVCWLGSVHQPALSKRVIINEWSTDEYPTRILGQYRVLGRAKPVVLTDAWGHRTGNLKIVTDNDNISTTTWRQLYLLLTQGKTLHLRTASRTMTGEPDLYFEVESYSRTRIGPVRTDGKIPFIHDINFIEVDRPATAEESLGLRSYQDLLDDYTDYQDLLDSYGALAPPDNSYLGVLNRSA